MAAMVLTEDEGRRVKDAVAAAEAACDGEIVVVVTRRASDYALPRAAVTLAVTATAGLGLSLLPTLEPLLAVGLQIPLAIATYVVVGLRPILLALTPDIHEEIAVRDAAKAAFFDEEVARAPRAALLFVSLFEHRVALLPTPAIAHALDDAARTAIIDDVVAAARRGALTDGLVSAVGALGRAIAAAPSAPARPATLDDAVRTR